CRVSNQIAIGSEVELLAIALPGARELKVLSFEFPLGVRELLQALLQFVVVLNESPKGHLEGRNTFAEELHRELDRMFGLFCRTKIVENACENLLEHRGNLEDPEAVGDRFSSNPICLLKILFGVGFKEGIQCSAILLLEFASPRHYRPR